jgi:hypothetical protein
MPEFAQFVAPGEADKAFQASGRLFEFDLPNLDLERTVILFFKVSGPRNASLRMAVNPSGGQPPIDFELDSSFTSPRSWHERVGRKPISSSGQPSDSRGRFRRWRSFRGSV